MGVRFVADPHRIAFDALQATSCSQSQFGRVHHLRRQGTAQVEPTAALSVIVRWEPLVTAVNGRLVARSRGGLGALWRRWLTLTVGLDHPRYPSSGQPRLAAHDVGVEKDGG